MVSASSEEVSSVVSSASRTSGASSSSSSSKSDIEEVNETVYATAGVNIRAKASADAIRSELLWRAAALHEQARQAAAGAV